MSKIDIDKFIEHLVKFGVLDGNAVQSALFAQGLILSNYKIQKIGENSPMQEEVGKNQESEDERIRKDIIFFISRNTLLFGDDINKYKSWIAWLEKQSKPEDMGEVSDGYHTFNELYYYRMLYNAAFFNRLPKDWVHKSKRHHDGEECFGGGWFIVMANLPTGQISNHYELKDWDLFQIPEKDIADEWDGHTPQQAAERLHKFLLEKQVEQNPVDKVEPKFHEGDLVVDDCGYVWKIEGILNQFYLLEGVEGGESRPTIEWVNKTFHLWSATKGLTHKEVSKKSEQDKKIEVDPDDIIEENYQQQADDLIDMVTEQGKSIDKEKVLIGARKDIALSIMNFLDRNTLGMRLSNMERADLESALIDSDWSKVYDYMKKKLEKQDEQEQLTHSQVTKKSDKVWSDDDEKNLQWVIDEIQANKSSAPEYDLKTYDKFLSWLESIKDRVQPQPKWNEEDERLLTSIYNTLEGIAPLSYKKELDWLKSIKERMQ